MPSKPICPADIAELVSIVAKAQLKLGLQKGSPELEALAAQIIALREEFEDEDELVRFVVADRRRSDFRIVKGSSQRWLNGASPPGCRRLAHTSWSADNRGDLSASSSSAC